MWPIEPPSVVSQTEMRPAETSVTAWLKELYGTCCSVMPVTSLNSVEASWPLEPMPSEA